MTSMTTLSLQIAETAADADFGQASARKIGRNPRWPYVPVILTKDAYGVTRASQILGLAYVTREEAIARAERKIAAERKLLAEKLAEPRHRALREFYGLPTEL